MVWKPHKASPLFLSPEASSSRIGEPDKTALSFGSIASVSGKLQQTFFATGMQSLFASPGVISDS